MCSLSDCCPNTPAKCMVMLHSQSNTNASNTIVYLAAVLLASFSATCTQPPSRAMTIAAAAQQSDNHRQLRTLTNLTHKQTAPTASKSHHPASATPRCTVASTIHTPPFQAPTNTLVTRLLKRSTAVWPSSLPALPQCPPQSPRGSPPARPAAAPACLPPHTPAHVGISAVAW